MEPGGRMYQAATQVNILSPEITNVVEADALHDDGRQYHCSRYGQGYSDSTGVLDSGMMQDGGYVNLGDPLSSFSKRILREYIETSRQRRGSMDGSVEVGLTGSTRSTGEPYTWGSGQQGYDGFNTCLANPRRFE